MLYIVDVGHDVGEVKVGCSDFCYDYSVLAGVWAGQSKMKCG